jgi:hypothetical protein
VRPQVIYSRYEFPLGDKTTDEVFEEYRKMFDVEYNERGLRVGGVSAAINVSHSTVILLTYSEEADDFLRLKFYGKKDVQFNSYKPKVENEI